MSACVDSRVNVFLITEDQTCRTQSQRPLPEAVHYVTSAPFLKRFLIRGSRKDEKEKTRGVRKGDTVRRVRKGEAVRSQEKISCKESGKDKL